MLYLLPPTTNEINRPGWIPMETKDTMNRYNPPLRTPMIPHDEGAYVRHEEALVADDLIGINEITHMYGMSKALLCCWVTRTTPAPFPKPIKRLAMGPVFSKREVRAWMARYKPVYREITCSP